MVGDFLQYAVDDFFILLCYCISIVKNNSGHQTTGHLKYFLTGKFAYNMGGSSIHFTGFTNQIKLGHACWVHTDKY